MAEAQGDSILEPQEVHRHSGGPCAGSSGLKGVLATTVLSSGSSRSKAGLGDSGKAGVPLVPRGATRRKDDVGCWVFDAYV